MLCMMYAIYPKRIAPAASTQSKRSTNSAARDTSGTESTARSTWGNGRGARTRMHGGDVGGPNILSIVRPSRTDDESRPTVKPPCRAERVLPLDAQNHLLES